MSTDTQAERDFYIVTGLIEDKLPPFTLRYSTDTEVDLERLDKSRVLLRKVLYGPGQLDSLTDLYINWERTPQGDDFWLGEYFNARDGKPFSKLAKLQLLLWIENVNTEIYRRRN